MVRAYPTTTAHPRPGGRRRDGERSLNGRPGRTATGSLFGDGDGDDLDRDGVGVPRSHRKPFGLRDDRLEDVRGRVQVGAARGWWSTLV